MNNWMWHWRIYNFISLFITVIRNLLCTNGTLFRIVYQHINPNHEMSPYRAMSFLSFFFIVIKSLPLQLWELEIIIQQWIKNKIYLLYCQQLSGRLKKNYKEIIICLWSTSKLYINKQSVLFFLKFKPKILCKLPKLFATRPILVGYNKKLYYFY